MRLLLASLIFLVTVLDMNFGSGRTELDVAALAAALLLCVTVVVDHVWLDRPGRRRAEPPRDAEAP
jgi:hypothetical protein